MEEALVKRVLPHSVEAEQSVIGSMLMDRDAIIAASEIVVADDFYQRQYGIMFDTMVELFNEGKPVDLVTLQDRLKEKDVPPEVCSLDFVRDILATVPTSANVRSYATIVHEKAVLRRLIRINEEIANNCYSGKDSLEVILADTEKQIFNLLESRASGDFVPIRQVALNVLDKIEQATRSKSTVTGLPTGFIDLDYRMSGLQPSDLIIIAARPAMGKTALALNLAMRAAISEGAPVGIFSLEMSEHQLVQRMISLWGKIPQEQLSTGRLSKAEGARFFETADLLRTAPLFINETPAISTLELRSQARRLKAEHGLGLIVVDYLQLMRSSRRTDSRELEISDISRSLKAIAKELDVPVVALSQLNRKLEERTDKRPLLSDLRESGAIEQDADVIMFIYRDEVYHKQPDNPHKGSAEIIIGKQRNGPIGTATLAYLGSYTAFEDLEPGLSPQPSEAGGE